VTMAYAGANFVRDPHTTLEIAPGASKHEIKKAYRRLALQYHPDVCDGNHCTTNFQQINFAYEVKQSPSTLSTGLDRRNSLSISSYSS
jgi:DnaJ-class molecular chaperone